MLKLIALPAVESDYVSSDVLLLSNFQDQSCAELKIIDEADTLAAVYGSNAYSDFLRKHRRRPSRHQAETIGRLIGARVKADDGSMQPELTLAEAVSRVQARKVDHHVAKRRKVAHRFKRAIAELAEITVDPTTVLLCITEIRVDAAVRSQIDVAVHWLSQFVEAMGGRDDERAGGFKRSAEQSSS